MSLYHFEDVGTDLPRPPLAALRAFFSAGLLLSPKGWAALSIDQRRAFVALGAAPTVDLEAVHAASRAAPMNELRMFPRQADPDAATVPESLAAALRPRAHLADATWAALRPLDRFVLARLAANGRLLSRALREILPRDPDVGRPWDATLAHAVVTMRPDRLEKLRSLSFLDGRAFVLARVAGVRVARRAAETFDLRADRATGTIELDWTPLDRPGTVMWQAHVSAWDGSFSAAASLAAASTAAIALADMVADEDDEVNVGDCRLVAEAWRCGADGDAQELATAVLIGRPATRPGGTMPMIPVRPAAAAPPPAPPAPAAASKPAVAPAPPPPPPPAPLAAALAAPFAAPPPPSSRAAAGPSRLLVNVLLGGLAFVIVALVAILAILLGGQR